MPNQTSTLDRLVDRCGQLYSLPVVAMRVLKLTESPTVDVRAIKECIENDPALTSKVLRVVNSSLFGLSREVTDLNQAIALLGINPLKLLVLGFSLPGELFVGINGDILRRYWHRTLIKAVAAREISQSILGMPGDEAFLAGLLDDIGALVLLQEAGETYARFLDAAFARAANVAEAERAALGFDHTQLSARLLERWRLPAALVLAVEAGQSPERIAALEPIDRPIAQVLYLAELVAGLLSERRTDLLGDLLYRGREYLALTTAQLSMLVGELAAKVDSLADVLQLELPPGNDYQAILAHAHERLSVVAAGAAEELLSGKAAAGKLEPDESLLAELRKVADELAADHAALQARARRRSAALEAESRRAAASFTKAASQLEPSHPAGASSDAADDLCSSGSPGRQNGRRLKSSSDSPSPQARRQVPGGCNKTPHDPGLIGRVTAAVATCRQARRSLSLLVVELDQYDDLLIACGRQATERLAEELGNECRQIEHRGAVVMQSRDMQYTVILPDCDRRQAIDVSNELVARVRDTVSSSAGNSATIATVSIGVASVVLPPKNFPAAELMRAAERCLGGARLSGGNAVKSIEIY
jgi:HD-like signal output (HDOD) protein/GGDEF domain-containing protein